MKLNIKGRLIVALAISGLAAASAQVYAAHNKVAAPFDESLNTVAAGGTCASPTSFSATPYNDTGTTVGSVNVISSVPAACSQWGTTNGPEAIYSFVAGTGANLTFTVTPGNGRYDPAAYLVSTCNSGASCVVGADDGYYGDPETFTASSLSAGTTYYLHIDSYYSSAGSTYADGQGPYTLGVTGTFPVSLQDFRID